jgi:uroporphyrinogen decarboxylase
MTSYERLFKTLRGEAMDGHAVMPYDGNFSIHAAGYDVYDCYTNGKTLAEAQTKAWTLTGQDAVVAQSDQYYMSEGMGLKTQLKPGSLSTVKELPVKTLKDIPNIKVPDPYHDGRMYVYIEAVGLLAQRFGKEVPIRAPGTGAFTMAGHLMEPSNLILSIFMAESEEDLEAQELILQLLETTYECHYRFVEACVKAGATIVQSGDSLASLDMISPLIYEKYAYPFEKRFFQRISKLKKDYDFVTLLHICGNNARIADKLADTGCDLLECDYKVDLADYAARIGEKVCLVGNLNPAGNLFTGTPDSVRAEAKTAMEHAQGARHILGSGCEVAVEAPVENIKAMVDFGHSVPFTPGP